MVLISSLFDLSLKQNPSTITITLQVQGSEMTTANMPHVVTVLKHDLPTILHSKCFNEDDIPFHKEVLCTELGHLFEHILLEYLCIAKIGVGYSEAIFSGITKWDWNKDPYGTFHIDIDIEEKDRVFLSSALQKTGILFEKILLHPVSNSRFLASTQMHAASQLSD